MSSNGTQASWALWTYLPELPKALQHNRRTLVRDGSLLGSKPTLAESPRAHESPQLQMRAVVVTSTTQTPRTELYSGEEGIASNTGLLASNAPHQGRLPQDRRVIEGTVQLHKWRLEPPNCL